MLGRYRLVEQIGSGGMGVVYRAHDERLDRDVAIKLLNPGSIRSAIARHRVRNEALALSRLSHPNIETIFEFDTKDDCDFLVVELIPGASLDELLNKGPLPQTLAVSLTIQLLRGLAAAHEKGIIHRDLKPSNLRLTQDSFLKILDFGLAHIHDQEEPEKHNLTTETHSTVLSGTLAYMSPEQLRGTRLDPRSDIYGAGLVLYQMCTGRLPFTESGALLIDAVLNKSIPPPRKVKRDITPELEAVILKALEKDPKRRYQSAREMLDDLEKLSSSGTLGSTRRRRVLQVLAVVLILAVIPITTLGYGRRVVAWLDHRLHPVPSDKYVAVMPFRSVIDDDPAFDQGLTEAVAVKLMEITAAQPVQVVSPRELVAERVEDVADARKKLGVNLAIRGDLQQVKGTTRVSLELIDASTRRLLRATTFSVNVGDTFALQDQIIEEAVQILEIEMHKGLDEEGHGTTNADAFRLYTRGVGLLQSQNNPEDVENAISELQHAIALDPGYADAHARLGMSYVAKYAVAKDSELIARGRQECERSSSLVQRLPAASICLGRLQLATGEYEQAASSFRSVIDEDPANDEAYGFLAMTYERLGRTTQAEEAYKQAISARPGYAVAHYRLALFYKGRARYPEAVQELKNAIKLAPQVPAYWSTLGGIYYYVGNYEEALSTLQHAIELRPTAPAYNNLGNSYFALKRYEDSISAFEQMVAMAPQLVQAHGSLARAYYWYPPKRDLARAEYEAALKLAQDELKVNPRDSDSHLLAALYSAMLNRPKDALLHLDFSLRASQSEAETLYFAAIIHAVLGHRQQAIIWRDKAIEQGYSVAEVLRTPELAGLPPVSQGTAENR